MKKMNKKGFTLMEMLIVIAILAILIAIAIPTFTSALEKSKQRTDMANVRSLKSLALADYMADGGVLETALSTNYKKASGGSISCWLLEGGQAFAASSSAPTNAVKIEAKWENGGENGWTRASGEDYITLTIDTGANGKISGTIPRLADDKT